MKITYYGHSTFEIKVSGKTILVDPFITAHPKASHINVNELKPDYIFLTHAHQDHTLDVEYILQNNPEAIVVSNWGRGIGVGVSVAGRTPTSLDLGMQYGLKAAHYPLMPEDFERQVLPPALMPHRSKIFGLTINPDRLSEIRHERRPNSKYASLANCRMEVAEAESMMRRSGIRWLSTTTKSIEEIATTILQEIRPERLEY